MSTPAWGIDAQRYEQMYVEVAKQLGVDELSSPVVPYIENERVLDLGCGTGWQARLLVGRGCTVVGVEVDQAATARATAWCERVIACDLDVDDLLALLGGDHFDVVAAGDVLEHLRDPVQVLRSLPRVLRPGGRVVASIPNVAHGSVRLALLTGSFPYDDAGLLDRTHLRFFTVSSVRDLFASAGYTIEHLDRVEVPLDKGTPYDRSLLPPGIEEAVGAMPEATTFEFVVVARPERPGVSPSPSVEQNESTDRRDRLLDAQAEALRHKDEELVALRRTVADLERRLQREPRSTAGRLWQRVRHRIARPFR
jgi:SAM-dependent methyltransferase